MNFNDLRLIRLKKENPKEERFWLINVIVPLLLTAVLYTVLNSSHLFDGIVYGMFGPEAPILFGKPLFSESLFRFLCLYLRDFFWGYAIVYAVAWMFHENRMQFRKALGIVFLFETALELYKLFSISARGFSIGSMAAIAVGNLVAAMIVMIRKEWLI